MLVEQELNQLGSGGAATVAVADGPRNLTCDIVERNSLAVVFNHLRLATTELASATAVDLERISKALADEAHLSDGADPTDRARRRRLRRANAQQSAAKGRRRPQLLRAARPPRRRDRARRAIAKNPARLGSKFPPRSPAKSCSASPATSDVLE